MRNCYSFFCSRKTAFYLVLALLGSSTPCRSQEKYLEWSDNTGKFRVDAKFLRSEGDHILIMRADGKEIRVPKARLSEASLAQSKDEERNNAELRTSQNKSPKAKSTPFKEERLPAKPRSATNAKPSIGKKKSTPAQSTPETIDDLQIQYETFSYSLGSKVHKGKIETIDALSLVFFDSTDERLCLTMNDAMSTVNSINFGITDDRFHLGSGKENFLLTLSFFVTKTPPDEKPSLISNSTNLLGNEDFVVRGLLAVNHLRPGPTYKRYWFGKPASQVSLREQEIAIRKGRVPLIEFGEPSKIESETEVEKVLYAGFSPILQLGTIKQFIADPDLRFSYGDQIFTIDEDARRSLFLFVRAVEVLRYKKGIRDLDSRQSIGE